MRKGTWAVLVRTVETERGVTISASARAGKRSFAFLQTSGSQGSLVQRAQSVPPGTCNRNLCLLALERSGGGCKMIGPSSSFVGALLIASSRPVFWPPPTAPSALLTPSQAPCSRVACFDHGCPPRRGWRKRERVLFQSCVSVWPAETNLHHLFLPPCLVLPAPYVV